MDLEIFCNDNVSFFNTMLWDRGGGKEIRIFILFQFSTYNQI